MVFKKVVNIDLYLLHIYIRKVGEKAKYLKKPYDNDDHNHNVDDPFYFPIHWDVGID